MADSPFPPHVPKMGDLLRVTPLGFDYVVTHYKYFCEEAYVASRFFATDYEGNPVIEISLGSRMLTEPLRFSLKNQMCLTYFDGQDRMVQVETLQD